MSNKPGSRFGSLFSRIFQFQFWLDVDRIKAFTYYLLGLFKRFFIPQPQKATESFEAAKKRLKLTNAQLADRQKALWRITVLMLVIAGLLFGYGVYQVLFGSIRGIILTGVVILISLTLAFRYHFWFFQIKEKKLGCSWKVWLYEGLLGGKKS